MNDSDLLPWLIGVVVVFFVLKRYVRVKARTDVAANPVADTAQHAEAPKPAASRAPKKYADLTPVRHWADDSDETDVVGESRYHKAIAAVAGNSDGAHADEHCTAILFPETDNKHDAEAVAVIIDDRRVGYLSSDDASVFRERLADEGIPGAVTSCPAHIRWGGTGRDGKQINYSITLQLALSSD